MVKGNGGRIVFYNQDGVQIKPTNKMVKSVNDRIADAFQKADRQAALKCAEAINRLYQPINNQRTTKKQSNVED